MTCMEGEEWKDVPRDPDLEADLGYDLSRLDVLQSGGSTRYMILPHDEEMIEEEMYIVIDECAVYDAADWR